jgi:hypothetical protein
MSKLLSVASLKVGDRFEFVSLQSTDRFGDSPTREHPNMMIVACDPKVNRIADSCFFRYRSEANPVETQSWNGTADIQVRIFTDREIPEAAAATPAAPRAAAPTVSAYSTPTPEALIELPEPPKEKAPRKTTRKPKAAAEKEADESSEKKPAPKKLSAKSSIKIKAVVAPPTPAATREAAPAVRKAVTPALKKKKA